MKKQTPIDEIMQHPEVKSRTEALEDDQVRFSAFLVNNSIMDGNVVITDLRDKTVAVIWNYVFRGEEIFPLLEGELVRRFPGIEFVKPDQFGNTHGS
ncbi:MAG: hypothetical protein QGG58_05080, partial [Chloroflexota bacterium]|nr:hypothetical protein [Chloroflexota bacterium]